jgi:glycosyltransferase involved in cell wall biosynthesis
MRPIVVVVCNAIDDTTRLQRRIYTDSPAASRKVFQMCQALKLAGVRPYVLSLGRGRADGSGYGYEAKVCCVSGVPTVYAPFSHRRGWSELVSLFGLLKPLRRLARHQHRAIIFYNRLPAYLPVLREASRLGYRIFLDLEDGEVATGFSLKSNFAWLMPKLFDRYFTNGALLACSALGEMTSVRPIHCYYGTVISCKDVPRWQSDGIACLMSGTLTPATGATLLIDAIRLLRLRQPIWAVKLSFDISGKGESLAEFEQLAAEPGVPRVRVHGRTTDARYLEILRSCSIGLALKPVGGFLAQTTFPSKVVEFAGAGLLVLTTDISDVRNLLGDGARYLDRNDPELLIDLLAEILHDRSAAEQCSRRGRLAAEERCSPYRAGENLRSFLFETP